MKSKKHLIDIETDHIINGILHYYDITDKKWIPYTKQALTESIVNYEYEKGNHNYGKSYADKLLASEKSHGLPTKKVIKLMKTANKKGLAKNPKLKELFN